MCIRLLLVFLLVFVFHICAMLGQNAPATLMPPGLLIYLEAENLQQLVEAWKNSPEKDVWLKSDHYRRFENSRIVLKLSDHAERFARSAGFPIDSERLASLAGHKSALGIFNPSEMEFVFLTELSAVERQATWLLKTKGRFEAQNLKGKTYYRNFEGGRMVCFAEIDPFLVIATQEDLMKECLALSEKALMPTPLSQTPEWKDLPLAEGDTDLHLFLRMDRLAENPTFRREWLFQNLDQWKPYRSARISVYLSPTEIRERRLYLRSHPDPVRRTPVSEEFLERYSPNGQEYITCTTSMPKEELARRMAESLWSPLPPEWKKLNRKRPAYGAYRAWSEVAISDAYEKRIDGPEVTIAAATAADPGDSPPADLMKLLGDSGIENVMEVGSTSFSENGIFVQFPHLFLLQYGNASAIPWDQWKGFLQDEFHRLYDMTGGGEWKTKTMAQVPYETWESSGSVMRIGISRIGNVLVIGEPAEYVTRVIQTYQAMLPKRYSEWLQGKPSHTLTLIRFAEIRSSFLRWQRMLDYQLLQRKREGQEPLFFSQDLAGLLESMVRLEQIRQRRYFSERMLEEEIIYSAKIKP